MNGIVVVGAGLAGLRAAEALRRSGYDGELTFVGDEPHRPYNRPPLSKGMLGGTSEADACLFDTTELEATWLLGRAATGLDPVRRRVTLDGGDELCYDGLVIATGCRARPWPQPLELAGVHVLRTLEDATRLREAAERCHRAVIVGAGFLGCEVAATLRTRGVPVSLVDVAPYPMAALGPEIGRRAVELHATHGVDLRLGAGVAGLEGAGCVERVRLSTGHVVEADLVLFAIGALPNTEWLERSGLELWRGGVRCDEHCLAVGAADVAVAGDVAAWPDPRTGRLLRVEHWANAAEMGMTAAANLLAGPSRRVRHSPVLTFWSDQYDVKLRAAGLVDDVESRTLVTEDRETGRMVLELQRDGELVGAVTLNSVRDHMSYRRQFAHG